MIKEAIAELVSRAAHEAQRQGEIPAVPLPEIVIERPQRSENGDYATSLPLRLKKAVGGPGAPIELARTIVRRIAPNSMIRSAVAAPPGFINFFIDERWLQQQVDDILQTGDRYGFNSAGAGKRVQVEFVSANPTGPVHIANGRGAVTGTTLARVLQAAGYSVEKEYYINDAGTQAQTFIRTLYARYQQLFGRDVPVPEGGYPGEYVVELAQRLRDEFGDGFLRLPGEPEPAELRAIGLNAMIAEIRSDLALLGIEYDRWFSESSLFVTGDGDESTYAHTLSLLRERDHVIEKDGATWFTAKEVGEDRENVLIRRTGEPTYFASDIAYHYDKFVRRGFDRVVDIWGADHQGHVARMKAAVEALGVDPDRLTILLYQLVTLRRGDQILRLSKRAGNLILVRDVVAEVGADACRFTFLTRSPDSPMEFDLDLVKRQSNENPVYYVQYAHARIAGILRNATERGLGFDSGNMELLVHAAELALIRRLIVFPELIAVAAERLEVHSLPHFAQQLATDFHAFYDQCQVVSADPELTAARLKLVRAAQTVLAGVLRLMGMSAPDRMVRASDD